MCVLNCDVLCCDTETLACNVKAAYLDESLLLDFVSVYKIVL
jgi:hypothetical protein